jgi:ketosteroid isomerase-like protein
MHANERLLRDCYDAFGRRDIPALMGLLSDDVAFVIPGDSVQSGTFSGKQEVGRYFSIVQAHTAGTHTVEPRDVLGNDDRAVALLRARGQRGDDVFDMTVVHVCEIASGKVTEVRIIPTDQYAFDAFWSE